MCFNRGFRVSLLSEKNINKKNSLKKDIISQCRKKKKNSRILKLKKLNKDFERYNYVCILNGQLLKIFKIVLNCSVVCLNHINIMTT